MKDILTQRGFPHIEFDSPYKRLPLHIQEIRLWATKQLNYYAVNDNDYYIEEAALLFNERKIHPYMLYKNPLIILTQGFENDTGRVSRNYEILTLSHNCKQIVEKKSGITFNWKTLIQ